MGAANEKSSDLSTFDQPKSIKNSRYGHDKNIPICSTNKSLQNSYTRSPCAPKSPRFVENVILIWLDASLENITEATQKSLNQIRRLTHIVKTFSDVDKCVKFIESIEDEKIFLIVSGSFGPQITPIIENYNQVYSIFLYCGNKANHEQWVKQYKKIRTIHTQLKELCETVKYHIAQYDKGLTSISVFPSSTNVELNEFNKEFIYLQVMKAILIEIRFDKKFRKDFMNYSRPFYLGNDFQMNLIDTFYENYDLHSPIWWYTRKCCLYGMLRKAFYKNDMEIMFKLAFFIRDLHRDIKKSYSDVHTHQRHPISVYRTTRMTLDEFTNIEKNYDGFIAFNDFLLTTLERSMALRFGNLIRIEPNAVGVIFKIVIDPITSSVPFISLNNLSYLSNTEGEILFSMNTLFRVEEIVKVNDRLYEIQLAPVNKKDKLIKSLLGCVQRLTTGVPGWYKLTKILMDANEYDQAEAVYKYVLSQANDNQLAERAYVQHQLGYIEEMRNNFPAAINNYQQSVDICLKTLPRDHPNLLATYINLASAYRKQGDYQKAWDSNQTALQILLQPHDPNTIVQQNNTAALYQEQKKYSEAQNIYEKSIQTILLDFPSHQTLLADTYHDLAGLFYSMKDYTKAISNYEKTIAIEEKFTPPYSPALASAYYNLATAYEGLQDNKKAVKNAENAVEIARLTFGNEHSETQQYTNYLQQIKKLSR
ncbi:unnamed protein product [Adineta steineri]|uniref:Uncharacterized protein n=2 Tax=Adineta steineri TaxID=433720 RepID=A0A815M555_9BILA|nr:unnamed protein product [Adineta steineri]CAF1619368.1 unnamed protein product [Adineta steineri]